jgi:hypothetical protein
MNINKIIGMVLATACSAGFSFTPFYDASRGSQGSHMLTPVIITNTTASTIYISKEDNNYIGGDSKALENNISGYFSAGSSNLHVMTKDFSRANSAAIEIQAHTSKPFLLDADFSTSHGHMYLRYHDLYKQNFGLMHLTPQYSTEATACKKKVILVIVLNGSMVKLFN